MSTYSVTVDLPGETYQRVMRMARGLRQPVQQALARMVESSLPSLAHVPARYRAELEAMEAASEEQLQREACVGLRVAERSRLERLLAKAGDGALSSAEEHELAQLQEEADRLMLRKSYASLILKWRGHDLGRPQGM